MSDKEHSGPESEQQEWELVRQLFEGALEQPREKRSAWLEQRCDNQERRQDVLELLAAEAASVGLFETPGSSALEDWVSEIPEVGGLPRSLGPYRLIEELGRGGMGTVYLAEHQGPGFERQVAVKVLRRGLDTEDVLARFANERRVLAGLQHPNIAQLLDAGTTPGGRPYLVMEAIEGIPITDYCDEHRLSIHERIRLLLDAASAIQAAHARLIVHRDLKPSNLLVDQEGHVKLLDFGIAKMLEADPEDSKTRTGQLLLTPQYAAPEQLRGEPITVATDVYQLGALLLRLLAGQSPRPVAETPALALQELDTGWQAPRASALVDSAEDPSELAENRSTSPRELVQKLRGDLDIVVHKALHPEPQRRYASVAELAADLRAWLDGRPIAARPDTLRYRGSKFLGRNRWLPPVSALALLTAVVFAAVVVRYTRQLERARDLAQAEAARAQEVQELMVGMFRSADVQANPDAERGPDLTVVEAMEAGLEKLRISLADRPRVRADVLLAIARTYRGLGAYDRGLPVAQEAFELYAELEGEGSKNALASLGLVGVMQRDQIGSEEDSPIERAEATLLRYLELAQSARPPNPVAVAEARVFLGQLYRDTAQPDAAEEHLRAVLATESATEDSHDQQLAPHLGEAARVLADLANIAGQPIEAESLARRAIELKTAAFGPGPSTTLALAHGTLATSLSAQQRIPEAEEHFRIAIDWLGRVAGDSYGDRLVQVNNYAVMLMRTGDDQQADAMFAEAVSLAEKAKGPDHGSVGDLLQNHGVVLSRLGRLEQAREAHERAAAIFRTSRAQADPRRAFPDLSLAGVLLSLERPGEGLAAAGRALEALEETLPAEHFAIAVARCRRARSLVALGRPVDAGPLFAEATAVLSETGTPAYRRECLEAAAEWAQSMGELERATQLRQALATIRD